jgi:predicted peroxiredoxin
MTFQIKMRNCRRLGSDAYLGSGITSSHAGGGPGYQGAANILKGKGPDMSRYVIIESRNPFDSRECRFITETARALKERGNEVVVFLVQNGVLAVRKKAAGNHLRLLSEAGVALLADTFSLSERGIQTSELIPAIQQAGVDALVDLVVTENTKAIWH